MTIQELSKMLSNEKVVEFLESCKFNIANSIVHIALKKETITIDLETGNFAVSARE